MSLIGDLRKLFEKQGLKLISFKVSETDPEKCVLTYYRSRYNLHEDD